MNDLARKTLREDGTKALLRQMVRSFRFAISEELERI